MSANRKLQGEVDRVLKKVEEGVETFDDIWEKVYSAGQQSLKEKYEGDLKKEIKKLQRLRDQIKTWIGSSDIKDKTALTEARKLIEVKMEEFKVCERETKTKAYSREGLAREEKLDPREIEKEEKRSWVQSIIDRIEAAVEVLDADLERMSSAKGKSKNKEQMEKLESRISTNRWHVTKLEQINRLLDNDSLEPNKLDDIKEEIEYYVECVEDEDAADSMEGADYNFYEDLQLDAIGMGGPGYPTETPHRPVRNESGSSQPEEETKREVDEGLEPPVVTRKKSGNVAAPLSTVAAMLPALGLGNAAPKPAASKQSTVAAAKAPTTAATTGKVVSSGKTIAASTAASKGTPERNKSDKKSAELSKPKESSSNVPAATSWASAATGVQRGTSGSPAASENVPMASSSDLIDGDKGDGDDDRNSLPDNSSSLAENQKAEVPPDSAVVGPPSATGGTSSSAQQSHPGQSVRQGDNLASGNGSASFMGNPGMPPLHPPSGSSHHHGAASNQSSPLISGMSGPPQGARILTPEMQSLANMLKVSMATIPPAESSDRSRGYTPRNPYPCHPAFPTQPPSVIDNPALFDRLPVDTLFLAFYYQQNTLQQNLAARQLKKHSWRFHKKYMTWFQRHEEPKVTTDEYEEGTYVYFDYESGWCQRIKSKFTFEYSYLEDELSQSQEKSHS
mmetsp:Transcript_22256/g.32374  ORF Transcript_22256/g.32374 Transcript_22256/m.32374 type:complete len:678 (-) Transcript_22256:163-2196(-)